MKRVAVRVSPPSYRVEHSGYVATWHDASHVCLPGHSCWVAIVALAGRPGAFLDVEECDDEAQAEAWVLVQLRARTGQAVSL